tara:strand:+ start:122 stop:322 length:201 start_codon:yes stop_codon:yes gene_type:complete
MFDVPANSEKTNPYNSIPNTPRSKYIGFNETGSIKKSKKVIGEFGWSKQKKVKEPITKADAPIKLP